MAYNIRTTAREASNRCTFSKNFTYKNVNECMIITDEYLFCYTTKKALWWVASLRIKGAIPFFS